LTELAGDKELALTYYCDLEAEPLVFQERIDDGVRRCAQGTGRGLAVLAERLSDPEAGVRAGAARAIAGLGLATPETLHALLHALDDADSTVRVQACAALAATAPAEPRAIAALVRLAQGQNGFVQSAACEALARCGAPAVSEVVKLSGSADPQ